MRTMADCEKGRRCGGESRQPSPSQLLSTTRHPAATRLLAHHGPGRLQAAPRGSDRLIQLGHPETSSLGSSPAKAKGHIASRPLRSR